MQMPRVRIFKFALSSSALLFCLFPLTAYSHDGGLDSYGCHYDMKRGDYHCHQGEFSGLSFASKIQVMQLLRPQHLDNGLPLPDQVNEEDITSVPGKTNQQATDLGGRKPPETEGSEAPTRANKPDTAQQIKREQPKGRSETAVRKEKTQPASNSAKTRQPLNEWIVSIRPDGLVIYENMLGERYYLDDNGKKVYVRRKR
jgi:hypothetical protein